MKRVYCPHCGRQTAASVRANHTFPRADRFCARGDNERQWKADCDAFAAGRRAAFKEALGILRRWILPHNDYASDAMREIRAAMKGPKR